MSFFDRFRNKTPDLESQKLRIQLQRSELENRKLSLINRMVDNISAKMSAFRSFPDELYNSGIKQGKNAGILLHSNDMARRHSRIAHNISPVAQAITTSVNTLVVGKGLDLEAQPIWRLIPAFGILKDEGSLKQRSEWMKTAESKYMLWAKRKTVSYDEIMNRHQQEQEIFKRLLIDGEYFEVYRYSANTKRNPMTIQLIRAEDVQTPSGSHIIQGNTEEFGIEYNAKGVAVAYHIMDHLKNHTLRVLKKGPRSGRIFVNHVKLGSNRRGVGIIAPMVTELMKLGDYEVLELQAAIVNALYAVWVETPEGEDPVKTVNAGIGDDTQSATTVSAESWIKDQKEINYTEGGLVVDALPGGYKIQSHDTKRPNVNFGEFQSQVKQNLHASVGMPISVIDKVLKNNYSASRGEFILAWFEVTKYRANQSTTNDLVYRMWLWGEIQNEKILAPGFFDDEEVQDAWVNAKWVGNQRPDIDPLRSVKANVTEQEMAYKTGKQITTERGGGDYDENLERVKEELKKVAENKDPFQIAQTNLTE